MKPHCSIFRSSFAILAGALIISGPGCSKAERAEAEAKTRDALAETGEKVREAYADSKAALSNTWEDVKSYTYEKREDFTAAGKAMKAEMEAKASELRAEYSEAKASASRRAAMEELKNSEADYREKLDALGTATAATWDSAKQNVIAAWNRFEAAMRNAKED